MKYNKVIIKLSGEALSGNNTHGIDKEVIYEICNKIKNLREKNVQVAVVVGGGNFWRGRSNQYLDTITTNNIGMLSTVMNALALESVLKDINCPAKAVSALEMNKIIAFANMNEIKEDYKDKVIVFAGGTGNPEFSTDTAVTLRAVELESDLIIKLSTVDGIYSTDPKKDPNAIKYDEISYDEVIEKELGVMDIESIIMAKKHNIPIIINKLENASLEDIINNNAGSIIK